MMVDFNLLCSKDIYAEHKGIERSLLRKACKTHRITCLYIDGISFAYLDEKTRYCSFRKYKTSKKDKGDFLELPPFFIDIDTLVLPATLAKMKNTNSMTVLYWIKRNVINSITSPLVKYTFVILDDKAINIEINYKKSRKLKRTFRSGA
jgi:hypothetical protein